MQQGGCELGPHNMVFHLENTLPRMDGKNAIYLFKSLPAFAIDRGTLPTNGSCPESGQIAWTADSTTNRQVYLRWTQLSQSSKASEAKVCEAGKTGQREPFRPLSVSWLVISLLALHCAVCAAEWDWLILRRPERNTRQFSSSLPCSGVGHSCCFLLTLIQCDGIATARGVADDTSIEAFDSPRSPCRLISGHVPSPLFTRPLR